jgi:flagellar hook-associated protein 2
VAGTASISGLISGLKTDDIISQLMELERMPIARLQIRQTALKAKLTAWQDANTRILAVKIKADILTLNSTFEAKSVTSSDESILKCSASFVAQNGTYNLTVNSLARAHQIKSDGYASTTAAIGTGTVTISTGSGAPVEIAIDETNGTLTGLRDAINKAGAGVTAAIVNDGSDTVPYRLLITSNSSGTAGAITLQADLTGETAPTFSTMQEAQNAVITLGEGEGAITVTKSTNKITDLIPGVTLDLQRADVGKSVTVTVQNDTSTLKQAIADFVEQYNNLIDFINEQFKYDVTTNSGGTLFSDPNLQLVHSEIASRIFLPVNGLGQSITVLSQIGITSVTKDGKLTVNQGELDKALANNLGQMKRLFAASGEATSGSVSYVSATDMTKPSGLNGYAVEITTVATQARLTAGVAQTDALAQDEQITINGKTIQLTAGMTSEQVVARINEYSSQTGVTALKTDASGQGSGNYLTFRNVQYGSGRSISVISSVSNGGAASSGVGNALVTESDAGGEAGTGTGAAGQDVAGTINGESATGKGQILTGNDGNANTAGLKLRITATNTGSYGTVHFTQGVASVLSHYLDQITRLGSGVVKSAEDNIQNQIRAFDADIASYEQRLVAKQERLIRQFAAMESALSRLQGQGSFLTTQLAQISNNWLKQ